MKLLLPALILKGSHYYLHPVAKRLPRVAHLIHWDREDQPLVRSVCNKMTYQFQVWSPRHAMPNFVEMYARQPQIATTILRYQIAIDNLCPDCYRYLLRMQAYGMLVPEAQTPELLLRKAE